nr:putative lipopolysaccharide heptosyltransferase III [Desulfobacterales bacterium]
MILPYEMRNSYTNILAIILKHIGDVLVTTPVLTALKGAYPDSRISILVNPGTEEAIAENPVVDEVLVLDRGSGYGVFKKAWHQVQFALKVRRKKFDLVLELSAGDRGAILGLISGARERVGFDPKNRGFWGRRYFFTKLVDKDTGTQHMVDYNLALVRALGIEPSDKRLSFCWTKESETRCRRLLLNHGIRFDDPYVVLHPTSRWMFKTWNASGYAAVCDYIHDQYRIPVVLSCAPNQVELKFTNRIIRLASHKPISLAGQLSIKELGCLVAHASLFVGVDSAPMHIAAAVNTPVIALFGPSGEHMWGPWGDGHIVIKKDWDCRPCGRDGCGGRKVSRCLEEIEPKEVFEAIDHQLGSKG